MWARLGRHAGYAVRRASSQCKGFAGIASTQVRSAQANIYPQMGKYTGFVAGMGFAASVGLFPVLCAGSVDEKSFIMIKPDGVQRGLVAEIIRRFESKGYRLVGIKILTPNADLAQQHYAEHDGKPFFPSLVRFLTSGPVVAMVWEGKEVIKTGRNIIGATNPLASNPGTIRGDFGIDVGRNIIHGSDGVDSAQKEIALWFKPSELADYEKSVKGWIYESAV